MKISFAQPFWIVTYFSSFLIEVVMPIHFEEYHWSSIRHIEQCSNNYCLLFIHCRAHISCDTTVFNTQIPSCNSIIMTYLYTLQWIFIFLCCIYIFDCSSFLCSQLGKSVDCTTCRCQMTNSVFELMHPLSPSQMIIITMSFLILIGIVAKLPLKGTVDVEMKDDKYHQTLTLCNCVFVHTQNLNYRYRIDAI